jgi:hypothetical protein
MWIDEISTVEIEGIENQVKVAFTTDEGVKIPSYLFPLPVGWDGWTRQEKIDWATAQVETVLLSHLFVGETVTFPDQAKPVEGKKDYSNLPGWATWTGQEAADWIDTNVTDLASAKVVLESMAKAIIYIRDIVIER